MNSIKIVFVNTTNPHIFTFFNNYSEHNIRVSKLYTILTTPNMLKTLKIPLFVYSILSNQFKYNYSYWLGKKRIHDKSKPIYYAQ